MPFVAIREGDRVLPYEATKADTLICPVCDDEMTFVTSHHRRGSFVAPHFRHQTNDDCAGESAVHLRMKSIAFSKLDEAYPEATVVSEEPVGSRRADILVRFPQPQFPYGHGIAVEVQYRNDSKDLLKTDQDYYDAGYSVLWLTQQHFDEYNVAIDHIQPVWPNALPQLRGYDGLDWPVEEGTQEVEHHIRLPPDYFKANRSTLRDAFETGRAQRSDADWQTHAQVWLSKPRYTIKRSLQCVESPSGGFYLKLSKGQQGERPEFVHLASRAPDIDLDGVGHRDSASAFSFYNLSETHVPADGVPAGKAEAVGTPSAAAARALIDRRPRMTVGDEWIAGDHAIFAFRGVPCVAVTSSNLMERVVQLTHTAADTVDEVDIGLLDATADVVARVVSH